MNFDTKMILSWMMDGRWWMVDEEDGEDEDNEEDEDK